VYKAQIESGFWEGYENLPARIQNKAIKTIRSWLEDPAQQGLRFKKVQNERNIYSLRINHNYRILGIFHNGTLTIFWVGTHDAYMRLMKQLS